MRLGHVSNGKSNIFFVYRYVSLFKPGQQNNNFVSRETSVYTFVRYNGGPMLMDSLIYYKVSVTIFLPTNKVMLNHCYSLSK